MEGQQCDLRRMVRTLYRDDDSLRVGCPGAGTYLPLALVLCCVYLVSILLPALLLCCIRPDSFGLLVFGVGRSSLVLVIIFLAMLRLIQQELQLKFACRIRHPVLALRPGLDLPSLHPR